MRPGGLLGETYALIDPDHTYLDLDPDAVVPRTILDDRESRRQLCCAYAARHRLLPLPFMPVHIRDEGLDGGGGADDDRKAVVEGGAGGMTALLGLLVKRLLHAARSSSAKAAPSLAAGDTAAALAAPDSGDGDNANSFDMELQAVLEGAPFDSSLLGQSLSHFSAVYLFHMQRELHEVNLRPGNAA